jgi:hypothetical protein
MYNIHWHVFDKHALFHFTKNNRSISSIAAYGDPAKEKGGGKKDEGEKQIKPKCCKYPQNVLRISTREKKTSRLDGGLLIHFVALTRNHHKD